MVVETSGGNLSCFFRSTIIFQSLTEARMPASIYMLLLSADPPSRTKLMKVGLACIGGFFFRATSRLAAISPRILSFRHRYIPSVSAVLQEDMVCSKFNGLSHNVQVG
ncbi:hypothetical protein DPMN_137457 [Dreissena polymorpha]|uniref:Uncharacterized protein n=1 Tax=Dreissena polymorpha TaxID=45954 RepID=A0A9D4G1V4_DREPO|nr:hypothetical protein DPMN_137457 [Dreissena polymorpha]